MSTLQIFSTNILNSKNTFNNSTSLWNIIFELQISFSFREREFQEVYSSIYNKTNKGTVLAFGYARTVPLSLIQK